MSLYPLLFSPTLKDYIWGGRNLADKLGRSLPDGSIAESWEIAAHPDGVSTVTNGTYAGHTLTQLHQQLGLDLIGTRSAWAQERGKFPLLVKLLDANRNLSVQVHPNDEYAQANEGNELGKTEMWVVLHAEPDARIQLGVKHGTTPQAFRQAIADGQLEPFLHYIPVQTGDFVDVPAGSLHAIMNGLLIAEIQQNSNTTYRVYDWNRVGHDGQPRPLHVDKALAVINFQQTEPGLVPAEVIFDRMGIKRSRMVSNRYFTVERVELEAGRSFTGHCSGDTFEIWGVLQGRASIHTDSDNIALNPVTFTLLPAQMGTFTVTARENCQFLRSYVDGA